MPFSGHIKFLTLMIMIMNLLPKCGIGQESDVEGWFDIARGLFCLWLQNISHEPHVSPILWLGFVAYEMLMSLFFLCGTKKIYSSNLEEYGNITEMETTILVFIYDVIELGVVAEFQDLLWLRQSFDAVCINAVKAVPGSTSVQIC